MNDPDRLLESKSSPLSRALLGSLKHDAPSRASKKRALAGAALAATAAHTGHSAASAGTALLLAKWTAAGALLGGVASGGVVVLNDAQDASQAAAPTIALRHTATAPAATRVIPTTPSPPAQKVELDKPREAAGAQAAGAVSAPIPSNSGAAPTSLRKQRLMICGATRARCLSVMPSTMPLSRPALAWMLRLCGHPGRPPLPMYWPRRHWSRRLPTPG